jgi:hypothetical protein
MSVLNQIKNSQLSKQGRTNLTGQFEGTPSNVGASIRGQATAIVSPAIPPRQNPIDVTYEAKPQPTYLDYMQAANKR